jgi:hypothetical protein
MSNPLRAGWRLAIASARAYLCAMGRLLLVAPLFAILAGALWYAASYWMSVEGPAMPTTGYVAMVLGIVFSLLVGCGLMALAFFSSRHGYDEPARMRDDKD